MSAGIDVDTTERHPAALPVAAMPERRALPASFADLDDDVLDAAARAWIASLAPVERALTRGLLGYAAFVVVAGALFGWPALLLAVPHFWVPAWLLAGAALRRRAVRFGLAPTTLPAAVEDALWRHLEGSGPRAARPRGMRLRLGRALDPDDGRADAVARVLRARRDQAVVLERAPWWRRLLPPR
jgi:hypothetical protein